MSDLPRQSDLESLLARIVDEFTDRCHRGERPDTEAYARAHPELAGLLREVLPSIQALAPEGAGAFRPPADGDGGSARTVTQETVDHLDSHLTPTVPAAGAGHGADAPSPFAYDILGELGRGGMGVVYRARHRELGRVVALKMIKAGAEAGDEQRERFRSEARAVARLRHPGIVQLYEAGEHDGQPYFALEYIDGGSLAARTRGEPQPPAWAAATVEALARAMQVAHEHGLIHRDLKPANVLLDADGTPKVTDFGLVKGVEGDGGHTQSGAILGTPSYMAPEQASGGAEPVTALADVYALGAILYDLIVGRPPFKGTSVIETLVQLRQREPVPPRQLQPACPRDLEVICLKCLHKEPRRRYPSAETLADDLRRFLDGQPIWARPVGRLERAVKWCRRHPVTAGLVAALALVTALGLGAFLWQSDEARRAAEGRLMAVEGLQAEQAERLKETAGRLKAEEARGKETAARLAAEEERGKETAARLKAEEARGRAFAARDASDYWVRVNLGDSLLRINKIAPAAEVLDGCTEELRHFEWHYLRNQCRGGTLAIPGAVARMLPVPGGYVTVGVPSPGLPGATQVTVRDLPSGRLLRSYLFSLNYYLTDYLPYSNFSFKFPCSVGHEPLSQCELIATNSLPLRHLDRLTPEVNHAGRDVVALKHATMYACTVFRGSASLRTLLQAPPTGSAAPAHFASSPPLKEKVVLSVGDGGNWGA